MWPTDWNHNDPLSSEVFLVLKMTLFRPCSSFGEGSLKYEDWENRKFFKFVTGNFKDFAMVGSFSYLNCILYWLHNKNIL